jgi:hypothetical protein
MGWEMPRRDAASVMDSYSGMMDSSYMSMPLQYSTSFTSFIPFGPGVAGFFRRSMCYTAARDG